MDDPVTVVQKERILVFRPDGPQGAKLGVIISAEDQQRYTRLVIESVDKGLGMAAFLGLIQQEGFNVFDASSI